MYGGIQQLRRQVGWVGGQLNVYAHKVKDHFLFTWIVYEGWVGGPKSPKICLRSFWMPPEEFLNIFL